MTPTLPSPRVGAAPAHVEAYCSTGTSPGAHARRRPVDEGRLRCTLELDHLGPVEVEVGYEDHGAADARAVVVLGGISASRHLAPTPRDPRSGWWPGVVGSRGALDPDRLRVVGVDYLGGPAVPLPTRGPVTTRDQARAVLAVLDHVGIRRCSVVGASYGGMVALALAALAPERLETVVVCCAAHRNHPMATAIRAIQRDVVRLGAAAGRDDAGLALARALAMTTYRGVEEFEDRFEREATPDDEGVLRFPVEGYLKARGRDFADRFHPDAFLRLSESIDLHETDPAQLTVPSTLLSFDADAIAPPWLVEELRRGASAPCRHVSLSSPFGHDAFLKEAEKVSRVVRRALAPWSGATHGDAGACREAAP